MNWRLSAIFLTCCLADAGVVIYSQDRAGFLVAAGAGAQHIHFDDIAPGTDLSGGVLGDVGFGAAGSPLLVVPGAATFTPDGFIDAPNPAANQLYPTSGRNVLSPGGTLLAPGLNPAFESDSILFAFAHPVEAFGFDLLSQSADGVSYVFATVYDQTFSVVYSELIPISNLGGGGASGGADFWGIAGVAGTTLSFVFITEWDDDAHYPDSNAGFDSLVYRRAGLDDGQVPEPASFVLIGAGLLALGLHRRKRKTDR